MALGCPGPSDVQIEGLHGINHIKGRWDREGFLGWSRDLVIRQSCGKQLAPVSLAAWVPSSLNRAQPVFPALPTHSAITQTVFGMALA